MESKPQPLANRQCPLCGGPNACAPAASGSFETPCWCRAASFDAELLARLSAAERGVACICAGCVASGAAAKAAAMKADD